MNFQTHIILIPCDKISDGRDVVNHIENRNFDSPEALQNAVCFDEDNPMATEDLTILSMNEFMEAWNESDESSVEQNWDGILTKEHLEKCWVGYVRILCP